MKGDWSHTTVWLTRIPVQCIHTDNRPAVHYLLMITLDALASKLQTQVSVIPEEWPLTRLTTLHCILRSTRDSPWSSLTTGRCACLGSLANGTSKGRWSLGASRRPIKPREDALSDESSGQRDVLSGAGHERDGPARLSSAGAGLMIWRLRSIRRPKAARTGIWLGGRGEGWEGLYGCSNPAFTSWCAWRRHGLERPYSTET